MLTIDKKYFDHWMRNIMERLETLEKEIQSPSKQGCNTPNTIEGDRIMDNQDICFLLHISKRSLQRYRSQGILPYQRMGRSIYYKESDVKKFLNTNFMMINKDKIKD